MCRNKYGLVLNRIGFEQMLDDMVMRYVQPLARVFFKEHSDFKSHHSFIVRSVSMLHGSTDDTKLNLLNTDIA